MFQAQNERWTASCLGDNANEIKKNKNNYIIDAIKLLGDEGIHICDHEIRNESIDHEIKGEILK
jgi:hypothetical protein